MSRMAVSAMLGGALVIAAFVFWRPETSAPTTDSPLASSTLQNGTGRELEVVAEDLEVPWEIAFLPEDRMLVTERPGYLTVLGKERKRIPVPGVRAGGEGGLLGMALHPDFKDNDWLYLYFTAQSGDRTINRVVRYAFRDGALAEPKTIIDNLPGSGFHNGGRIAFGPPTLNKPGQADRYLFITTGDAGDEDAAQSTRSLAGKILRVRDDGSIPEDNPFGNAVYSYGHRNPQGLAWDDEGRLWATEHGRSGALSGLDELNLIEKGVNYGWPVIQGAAERSGMRAPAIQSGASVTWAPAGAAYLNGRIFFAGLRGSALYETAVSADGKASAPETHLLNEFGRLRALKLGPDGYLYFTTSNMDGRGRVREGDDKLIRVRPGALGEEQR